MAKDDWNYLSIYSKSAIVKGLCLDRLETSYGMKVHILALTSIGIASCSSGYPKKGLVSMSEEGRVPSRLVDVFEVLLLLNRVEYRYESVIFSSPEFFKANLVRSVETNPFEVDFTEEIGYCY